MSRKPIESLTAAEWKVMKIVWDLNRCAARDVYQRAGIEHQLNFVMACCYWYSSRSWCRYRQQAFNTKTDQNGQFSFKGLYKTGEQSAFLVTIVKGGFAMQSEYVLNREGNE